MTQRSLRMGFLAFLLLTSGFAFNLVMLQSRLDDRGLPRAALAASPSARAGLSTGAVVMLNGDRQGEAAFLDVTRSSTGDGPEVVRAIQRELQARGYEAGTADGMPGLVTRAAIMAYQADHNLALTAKPSDGLLQHILLGITDKSARFEAVTADAASAEAEQVIRTVQQSLSKLGYAPGIGDGHLGEQTVRAIREFEVDQGLSQTGRISGQLVARLARLAGQGRLADGR
ncbi:MAG: peptidoglycan-binding domain-containing protein [Hyphomicrobium sp.]